jgi:hypothetical protein
VTGAAADDRPSVLVRIRRLVTTAVAGYLLLAACGVIWARVDEAAVPSGNPSVPAGFSATDGELQCGSGGCWRQVTVSPPADLSRTDAVDALQAVLGCGPINPLTFRRSCVELDDLGSGPLRLVLAYR